MQNEQNQLIIVNPEDQENYLPALFNCEEFNLKK